MDRSISMRDTPSRGGSSTAPDTAAARALVLREKVLRRAWKQAFEGPGGMAALRRADDPERVHKGRPSPFAGYERARRQVFAPGTTDADRSRWRRLAAARANELRRVDAAVAVVLAAPRGAQPSAAARPTTERAPGERRARAERRVVGIVVVVFATVVILLAAGAVLSAPRDPHPPPLAGRTVAVTTSAQHAGAASFVASAGGGALAIAVRCSGDGAVDVRLGSGERWTFPCAAAARTSVRTSDVAHVGPFSVSVRASGGTAWGLTIAVRPVGSSTSKRAAECGACLPGS